MVPLASLWLPIVLSAVIVFVASSLIHMLLGYHRSDYTQLPDEDNLRAALRKAGVKRGLYVFPYCTHRDMKSPATLQKFEEGPVGMINILPSGRPNMGKLLGLWFVYCLLVAFFVAYVACHTMPRGEDYLAVFRIVGATAFIGFGLSQFANGTWKAQPWSMVIKEMIDGLIYGLLVGGTFGWLWPR